MPVSYDPQREARVPRADYASQLTFLRLLATSARQVVTYHCKGGEADLKLRGTGDSEFTSSDFETLSDNCSSNSRGWGKATIEIETTKTAQMPIRDIATSDVGFNGQQ